MNPGVTPTGVTPTGEHTTRQGDVVNAGMYPEMAQATPRTIFADKVRWGPVWAGLMTALTSYLVIQMFCYWIGLLTIHAGAGGVYTGGPANVWVTAIVGLIAFFLGGWLATSSAAPRSVGSGMLNGFMVWALGVVAILAFAAFGIGLVFGTAGEAFGQFFTIGIGHGALNSGMANLVSGVGITRDASGWGLLFLILSAITAVIGGSVGSRTPIGRATPMQ